MNTLEQDRTSYEDASLKSLCSDYDNLCKQRLAYPKTIIRLNKNSFSDESLNDQNIVKFAPNESTVTSSTALDETFEPCIDTEYDPTSKLKYLRLKFPKNIVLGYLNINSIRNKFSLLSDIVHGNIDYLTIAETKLDNSFPSNQFMIPGLEKPYRQDVSGSSGGLLVYVSNDIPSWPKILYPS